MGSFLGGGVSGLELHHAFAGGEVVLEPEPDQLMLLMGIDGPHELLLNVLVLVPAEDGELTICVL